MPPYQVLPAKRPHKRQCRKQTLPVGALEGFDGGSHDDSCEEKEEYESDNELISSGEVTEHIIPSFSSSEPATKLHVNLPSMLSANCSSELFQSAAPPQPFPTTTLVLQQPLFDLSFSESSSSIDTVCVEPEKALDRSSGICLEKVNNLSDGSSQQDSLSKGVGAKQLQQRRTISELSPDDSVSKTSDQMGYLPKRRKTRGARASPEIVTKELQAATSSSHVCDMLPHLSSPVPCIDLTASSSDGSVESGQHSLLQEEVDDYDEEQDVAVPTPATSSTGSSIGSPSFLPPTPGKEDAKSILTRKTIAFSCM